MFRRPLQNVSEHRLMAVTPITNQIPGFRATYL
jgi:hypothetical protein